MDSWHQDTLKAVSVVVVAISGYCFTSQATDGENAWYGIDVKSPELSPPNWFFSVIWTFIYAIFIWTWIITGGIQNFLFQFLFFANILLNFIWLILFFGSVTKKNFETQEGLNYIRQLWLGSIFVLLVLFFVILFQIYFLIYYNFLENAVFFCIYLIWIVAAGFLNIEMYKNILELKPKILNKSE